MNNFGNLFDMNKVQSMMDKVKNAVMNYSEYEGKVREATNNDPWGTASTTMMDIAQATHNLQHFYEIMNTIYKRMQEPVGPTWRQTYKALQLLEFLIKNGNDKVIDYTRDHVYELKALQNYNYIDEKKKDQGINIQHRAKEILDLLNSDQKIQFERQKARENRNKYGGVSSEQARFGGNMSFGSGGDRYQDSSRYDSSESRQESSRYDAPVSRQESSRYDAPVSRQESVQSKKPVDRPVEKVEPKPVSKPAEANLLDFGDDWADFQDASKPPSQPAAPSQPTFQAFAQTSPAKQTASQSFHAFSPTQQSSTQTFQAFSSPQASQPVFQAFSPAKPSQQPLGQSFQAFTPTKPVQTSTPANGSQNVNQTKPDDDFADFVSAQPSVPQSNYSYSTQPKDPFDQLVALDALSLSSSGKKEDKSGPALNAIAPMKRF
ncbi:hypothetical protein EDD86DRAFT_204448 [Gorgonomyces haynaldii]|nr:hypothetical protein EDD86DRAFT_204448 [Gorgonomyces haynaldii]